MDSLVVEWNIWERLANRFYRRGIICSESVCMGCDWEKAEQEETLALHCVGYKRRKFLVETRMNPPQNILSLTLYLCLFDEDMATYLNAWNVD